MKGKQIEGEGREEGRIYPYVLMKNAKQTPHNYKMVIHPNGATKTDQTEVHFIVDPG